MKAFAISLILLLAGCSGYHPLEVVQVASERKGVYTITFDQGGDLVAYDKMALDFKARGVKVEVRGFAASSATLFMGLGDDFCLTRDSILGFHGPSGDFEAMGTSREIVVGLMANYYPQTSRRLSLKIGQSMGGWL